MAAKNSGLEASPSWALDTEFSSPEFPQTTSNVLALGPSRASSRKWLAQLSHPHPPLHPAGANPPAPSYPPRSNLCVIKSASHTLSRGRLQFLTRSGIIQFVCILVIPIKYTPNNKCSNFSFIIFVFYSYCSNKIYTQRMVQFSSTNGIIIFVCVLKLQK